MATRTRELLDRCTGALQSRFGHYITRESHVWANMAGAILREIGFVWSDAKDDYVSPKNLAEQVKAFHLKFNHPVRTKPAVPSDEELVFRTRLITEEFLEYLEAAHGHAYAGDIDYARKALDEMLAELTRGIGRRDVAVFDGKSDLPAMADAIADLKYVLEGTNLVCGVDGDAVMEEVQRANMSKDAAIVASKDAFHAKGGVKPVKPPGWQGPDVAGCLKKQGWEG